MEKTLYLVRHCKATGQAPEAPLTREGKEQAQSLVRFFAERDIKHIISSPFVRAVQSIEPLATSLDLPVEIDERLAERVLSTQDLPDWMDRLEESFQKLDLKFAGGESGFEAMKRGGAVLEAAPDQCVLVTHGNMMGLLLKQIDINFGFEEWIKLSNPDVYEIKIEDEKRKISRLWR
ncbi:histidine phosphatase family protein [Planococcus sp. N028]|uniref:Histidine phosphatase family protein n=1 Tax=Planococcus shixiaomingii TaxID=3058393 RepID=A0ABT8N392_9BACL|nr:MULTISPECIES: histidine phosphatase family protein [unclassified Planococcus (in: firmicutes)]MDN7242015.1 histidine phosphatase family protein [Planococcus sp. N028]WKA54294.1 histidine phosphatase family protein [Planococcus sp. N022]